MPQQWQRHELILVDAGAWKRILRNQPKLAALPYLAEWAERGWPLIIRRGDVNDTPAMVPAAISLPPACGKLRIALQVDPGDVTEQLPPQNLRAVCEQSPISWRPTVAAVLQLATRTGVEPSVFGGLLWQSLTGLPYLSANSDLDLCWPVTHSRQAAGIVRGLSALDENSPPRIDGELILPDGGGVNWRELGNGAAEVIVKTMFCARLCPIADVFGNKLAWN